MARNVGAATKQGRSCACSFRWAIEASSPGPRRTLGTVAIPRRDDAAHRSPRCRGRSRVAERQPAAPQRRPKRSAARFDVVSDACAACAPRFNTQLIPAPTRSRSRRHRLASNRDPRAILVEDHDREMRASPSVGSGKCRPGDERHPRNRVRPAARPGRRGRAGTVAVAPCRPGCSARRRAAACPAASLRPRHASSSALAHSPSPIGPVSCPAKLPSAPGHSRSGRQRGRRAPRCVGTRKTCSESPRRSISGLPTFRLRDR